ncbi:MAG: family 20 glycosylhydrolase, partial [Ginsengibacter sp.]
AQPNSQYHASFKGNPSIIPLPQSLNWTNKTFPLNLCQAILISNFSLKIAASQFLKYTQRNITVKNGNTQTNNYQILLKLSAINSPFGRKEAYHLIVSNNSIVLTANTPHGIFNGLQTLYQLINGDKIQGCEITDYPAYNWRGYMLDVARNYQAPELIKQQIDVMAKYKMNIFHFHITEDIAWRLAINQYPQLTAPENMLRDKGKFYSIKVMKELIAYCKERFITLIPEIDMPGHSKAFTRAMGTDMQSERGIKIVTNILREVCTTYDIPYLHIGADEVIIKNSQFLTEVSEVIRHYNKQTIGWSPGGKFDSKIIHQLWGSDAVLDPTVKHIDSRALYITDMSPQSSVVTIFQRQLGGKPHGDSNLLGGEICLWGDRKIKRETDYITMNAVYPDMIAFGERSWRGGGYPDLLLDIGPDTSQRAKDYIEFENRLLVHKRKYFTQFSFPYVKQQNIKWKLFGPFQNYGDSTASFWPEKTGIHLEDSTADINASGGTIWLWYHNGEHYNSWLPSPQKNTTWYGFTRFWSDTDTTISLWIGFKNFLRTLSGNTPPAGEWDYNKSMAWINQEIISPPQWKNPGQKLRGHLELPLEDEDYYYRTPAKVTVHKGWNAILVKTPLIMSEELDPWQRRCMFSVMPVHKEEGVNWYSNEVEFKPDK